MIFVRIGASMVRPAGILLRPALTGGMKFGGHAALFMAVRAWRGAALTGFASDSGVAFRRGHPAAWFSFVF
jgi:hypothetical protein